MPSFLLNPSRLARHFYHECDRYLRYHATPRERRAAEGMPPAPDQSEVTQALLEGGLEWEETVAGELLEGLVRVGPGPGPLRDRVHSPESTLRQIVSLEPGEAVYQGTLLPPPSFARRFGLDPDLAAFAACRPDLIVRVGSSPRRKGRPLLRVVDVKASDELKASHRVQVALYAWILRDVAAEAGLACDVDVEQGGVWLFGRREPEWFHLATVGAVLERFLRERLPQILTAPRGEVAWHLGRRCEWCELFAHCRAEAELTRSVSLLPGLSVKARAYLREAPWGGPPIASLADLARALSAPGGEAVLDGCASLRGRGARLMRSIEAVERGVVVPHGGATVAMPAREGVRLVLSLERDPVSGRVYAAGLLRAMGLEVFGSGQDAQAFVAPSLDACADVRRDFLRALHGALARLAAYNEGRPRADRKSLQAYVFDAHELELLEAMLVEALSDPELEGIGRPLFLHFLGAGRGEGSGGTEVPYPVVVITRVVRELFAVPSPIALTLERLSLALPGPGYPYAYRPKPGLASSLSNALRPDAIFAAWYRGDSGALERVRGEVRNRLLASSGVVDGVRARAPGGLFAWPPRFELASPHAFRHPELGRLSFLVRHECFREALAVRELRALPWDERLREGVVARLVAQQDGWFLVEGGAEPGALEPDGGHPSRLLVDDSPEGERAQLSFDDHRHRGAFFLPPGPVRLGSIVEVERDGATGLCVRARIDVRGSKERARPQPGERLLVYRRYTDFTSDRVVQRLEQLDEGDGGDFVRLLRDVGSFDAPSGEPRRVRDLARKVAARARLAPSQLAAFERLLARRLLLVWGPPGTGKTYFVSRAVAALAEARRREGLGLRVAVTAFTHAAIENLLAATSEAAAQLGGELEVRKLGEVRSSRGASLERLTSARAARQPPASTRVVGGTVYELRRAVDAGMTRADLLIVDEASQLRLGELALASIALADGARLVLAGDDLQLPPLVQGRPPPPPAGERDLAASAFAHLRGAGLAGAHATRQLVENFRMNETLCRFPAETLYGKAYRPASAKVARRRARLAPRPGPRDELSAFALDPAFPLVLAMLEAGPASAENRAEARLVARLAAELRERLLDPSGTTYPDSAEGDARFWSGGALVVGPHHAHNRAVRAELARLRAWKSPPAVETVEKVQGQESDCVLVSYGVSDPEAALAEGEFLYGRSRLNVAVTRARAKCVVFLPRPLLDAPFDLLQSDEAAEGLGHMHALASFCRAHGEERVFPVGDGGRLAVVRARVSAPRA